MIPFNKPVYREDALFYIKEVLESGKISGDYKYTGLCSRWMEERFHAAHVLLTTSGSAALDMAALLLNIGPGDEVIMPSYTFVSTANAFSLRGAAIVFVDIRPDTMNLDEQLIECAITERTKAIVVVHYAGVGCEMKKIAEIASRHSIPIVEDAAQGVMASYEGRALGTIGDLGCYSFHATKNYSMGEGGALVVNDSKYYRRAEIIREKGTDRSRFFRGEIDKYSWVDIGSSYLPSDINAAMLYAQLEIADEITQKRILIWERYYEGLLCLRERGEIELPVVPRECGHNGHIFYIKAKNIKERSLLIAFLKEKGVNAVFHYIPLHSSKAGTMLGSFYGEDRHTTRESERLLRLPLYYDLTLEQCDYVISCIVDFYENRSKGL